MISLSEKVNCAIVTCGGLCPGLNNVIREIVNTLYQTYGIGGKVYGIQGGYRGTTV
jgi:6-phosphofructokinase 1